VRLQAGLTGFEHGLALWIGVAVSSGFVGLLTCVRVGSFRLIMKLLMFCLFSAALGKNLTFNADHLLNSRVLRFSSTISPSQELISYVLIGTFLVRYSIAELLTRKIAVFSLSLGLVIEGQQKVVLIQSQNLTDQSSKCTMK